MPHLLEPTQATFISLMIVVGLAFSKKRAPTKDEDPLWKLKRQQALIRSLQDQSASLVASQDHLSRDGLEKDAVIEELRLENRNLTQQVKNLSFHNSQLETKIEER